MGFLDKLKKTLWTSFFGEPERPSRKKAGPKKKPSAKKKKVPAKKKALKPKPKPKKNAPAKKVLPVKVKKVLPPPAVKKTVKALPLRPAKLPKPVKPVLTVQAPVPAPKPEGMLVGIVTHFFPQVKVAAIKIVAQKLSVGDEVLFKGVTTDFKSKIASMQINRVPVTQAAKGSEIGILVKKRVREGDQVFKL